MIRHGLLAMVLGMVILAPAWAEDRPVVDLSALQVVFLQPPAGNQPLTAQWQPLRGLEYRFTVNQPTLVTLSGHVGYQHFQKNGINTMVGVQIWTELNKPIKGSLATTNLDPLRHYEDMAVNGSFVAPPGTHAVKVMGRLSGNDAGSIFVKDPNYNGVWLRLEPLPSQ